MESVDAPDTVVTWFEENHLTGRVGIINNASTGASVQVDDPTQFVPGAFGFVESTGEYMFVLDVVGDI